MSRKVCDLCGEKISFGKMIPTKDGVICHNCIDKYDIKFKMTDVVAFNWFKEKTGEELRELFSSGKTFEEIFKEDTQQLISVNVDAKEKECIFCGKKTGFFNGIRVKGGASICDNCLVKYGVKEKPTSDLNSKILTWYSQHTPTEIKQLFDDGKTFDDISKMALDDPTIAPDINDEYERKNNLIQEQLTAAGVDLNDNFGTKKEFKELANVVDVDNGEVIKATASAMDGNGNTVLLICTNTRVIALDMGWLYGKNVTAIPLEMINGVQHTEGFVQGKITIVNGSTGISYTNVAIGPLRRLAETIKNEVQKAKNPTPVNANNDNDYVKQLRELKSLLDAGILTQEEFDAKKKQILGI